MTLGIFPLMHLQHTHVTRTGLFSVVQALVKHAALQCPGLQECTVHSAVHL